MKEKIKIIFIALLFLMIILFCSVKLASVLKTESCFKEQGIELPIVMYHNISQKHNKLGKYTILDTQFEEDLKFLKERGYNTITLTQLIDYVHDGALLPEKPIIITFDDGYESFYVYAYPLLKKYQMKAVMSIVGEYTDKFSQIEDNNVDYSHLNWSQINEMSDGGYVEIQNHTYNLHSITKERKGCVIKKGECIDDYEKELKADLEKLQKEILLFTGRKPNTVTYPYGNFCTESENIIKNMGFKACLTCKEVINRETQNKEWLYNLGRFNREHGKNSYDYFTGRMNLKD